MPPSTTSSAPSTTSTPPPSASTATPTANTAPPTASTEPHPASSESTWPPSFAREVATAVVSSLQQATSSARGLLVGCFQCHALKPGCWRRQPEQDGAWFDSDKLQVEHPFCYVNPVALQEAAPPSTLTSSTTSQPSSLSPTSSQPSQPSLTQSQKSSQTQKPSSNSSRKPTDRSHIFESSGARQPSPSKEVSPSQHSPRKQQPPSQTQAPVHYPMQSRTPPDLSYLNETSRRNSHNPTLSSQGGNSSRMVHGVSEKQLVANGRIGTRHKRDQHERNNLVLREEELPMKLKEDVVRYTDNEFRSPLVESFAAKLEADLRKLEYDRQRAEGEVVRIRELVPPEEVTSKELFRKCDAGRRDVGVNMGGRSVDVFKGGPPDIPFASLEFEGEVQVEGEVWEPAELESAFECYNMAAFYSYGSTLQATDKFSSKSRGEKFEEVFPVTFHNNNNNNTIKVFKPASESESPLPVVASKDESTIENVHEPGVTKENRLSQGELKDYINACIVADSADQVCVPCRDLTNADEVRDQCLHFDGKSFNKLLIFNLVKSIMSENDRHYPHILPKCETYFTQIVQKRVIALLLEERNTTGNPNPSGLQVFRNSNLLSSSESEFYHQQFQARRLVDSVVASELKAEDKHWQDFSREEGELKEAIAAEVFDDLMSDTTDLLTSILKRKLTNL